MPKSRLEGGRAEMSRPACSMRPLVWMSSPAIARSSVVLPHPDGPRKQTNSPSWISSEMSARAVNAPNCLVRRSMRRYALTSASSPSRCARPLLLGLGLRAVALLPLGEDLRAVQRRPLEVVLDHVLQHVAGDELERLRHLDDGHHRVSLVVELHGLLAHRPVDERLGRLEVLRSLDN